MLIALVKEQGGIELLVYKVKLINEQDSKEIFLRMNKQALLVYSICKKYFAIGSALQATKVKDEHLKISIKEFVHCFK